MANRLNNQEHSSVSAGLHDVGRMSTEVDQKSVHHVVKKQARRQFDSWAHTYDRSIVQHLLFLPSYRLFMEVLYKWRREKQECTAGRTVDLYDSIHQLAFRHV